MKLFCVLLCLSGCVYIGLAQISFFSRRDDRVSPFDIAQSFLPNPNRFRDRLNNLFNLQPARTRPAIIHDESPGQDQSNYQNNFNRPVVFPTAYPQERPDVRPEYNPIPTDPYQNNQPDQGIPNQEITERPVSFPVQDDQPSSGSIDNSSPNYETNQGGQISQENGPTQGQENSSRDDYPTEGSVGPNDFNYMTTQLPNLEDQTDGTKYENRFGSDGATLPTLPEAPTPNFSSRSVNFGSSGLFPETCQTVENEIGSCINLKQCEPYYKLVLDFKSNPGAVALLRSAHCGFEGNDPKVCCPRPGLPTVPPRTTTTTTTTVPTTTVTSTTTPTPTVEPSGKAIDTDDFVTALPDPPVCGSSNASFSRVVGGVDAKLGDFPWMALLGYKKRNNPTRWLCGGSLITAKHVLTASHCIYSKEQELYVVRLGELDLVKDDDGAAPVDVLIKSMIKHEQYSPKAYTNDIAILVLQQEIQFSDLIRPICLPQTTELRSMTYENYNPMVAGWGNLEARGPAATRLQVVQLPVVSNDMCKQAYRNYTQQKIDERVLCAGFRKGGKDSCSGDSGGPLMQPIWNSQSYLTYFFQIGVVSFGKGCAEAGFPGVYSRVTHFMPWVYEKVLGHA